MRKWSRASRKCSKPDEDQMDCQSHDDLTGVLPVEVTRLSTKGQIIRPKSVRDARAWAAGTSFIVEETGDGVLRPESRSPVAKLEEVAGCLRTKRKPATEKQMRAAVAREIVRRHDRGRY